MSEEKLETRSDAGRGDKGIVKFWLLELEAAEKRHKDWWDRGKLVEDRYRDERPTEEERDSKFNILWSNVETLKSAIYGRVPNPEISRRFKDADPIGRTAATVLERAVSFTIDDYDFDGTMKACVLDVLLPGRGSAWVRYHAEYGEPTREKVRLTSDGMEPPSYTDTDGKAYEGEVEEDDDGPYGEGEEYEPVEHEAVYCEHVHWMDFLHSEASQWPKVWWVAKREYLTRDQLVKRFGKEIGRKVKLGHETQKLTDKQRENLEEDAFKRALVWEIWDRHKKEVIWICPEHKDEPLDRKPDPLGLRDFFPCPKPLLATHTSDTLIPTPDYAMYQDLANELDRLTARMGILREALRVAGVYPADEKADLQRLMWGADNRLIPIENWAAWGEKGGLSKMIEFLPLKEVAETLLVLTETRATIKQDLYELTGISDIVRGASDAQETATAQRIKGNFATLRLTDRQNEVARFARDLIRLKAEIVAEHFSPETLAKMTGFPQLPEKPEIPPMPQPPQGMMGQQPMMGGPPMGAPPMGAM